MPPLLLDWFRHGLFAGALALCGCAGHGSHSGAIAVKDLKDAAFPVALAAAHGVTSAWDTVTASDGSCYVLDGEAPQIHRFAPDGTVLTLTLEAEDTGWRPERLVVDAAGGLTVSDRSLEHFSVYDTGGHLVGRASSGTAEKLAGMTPSADPSRSL